MFAKLKERFQRKDVSNTRKNPNRHVTFKILALLFSGALFGYIAYRKIEQSPLRWILLLLCPFIFLLVGLLIDPSLATKDDQTNRTKGEEVFTFYDAFLKYSAYENSYHSGFKKAVELLPICQLKEDLTDYLEKGDFFLRPPLVALDTRLENILLDKCQLVLTGNEEYSLTFAEMFVTYLDEYQEEYIKSKEVVFSPGSFSIILLIFFVFAFLAAILSYGNVL